MDAFTVDWLGEVNWLCPPPYLIPRTIRHALNTETHGTLIVPNWPSAPFWPLLLPSCRSRAPFVVDMLVLNKSEIPGRSGSSLPNTHMLAIKFVLPRRQVIIL